MKRVLSDFYDVQGGGFFLTSMTGETLLYRPKELYAVSYTHLDVYKRQYLCYVCW